MTKLTLTVVTLAGTEYVAYRSPAGGWTFPSGEFLPGEAPAAAARRIVGDWTKTTDPKLELMDFAVEAPDGLRFVFRALLTSDPGGGERARFKRLELPALEGPLAAKAIEEMQKTGLNYKLTRA